jgi:O-antigen/teichoic acid export membrane protein
LKVVTLSDPQTENPPKRWHPRWIARQVLGSQLRRNIISGNLGAVISACISILTYPIYLHYLGYSGFGVWVALGIIIAAAQIGNLGVPNAVAKIVAERYGAGDIQGVRACVTNALFIVGLVGVIAAAGVWLARVGVIAALGLGVQYRQLARTLLPYVGALSAYVMVVDSFNATLIGLGRMDISSVTQVANQAISLIVTTALLASGYGVGSLLVGAAVSYLALNIVTVTSIRGILRVHVIDIGSIGLRDAARILRFGGWVFGAAAISLLLSPLNKLMLSRYSGVSVLPVYEMAYTGAMRIRGLFETGLRALMPEVSHAMGAGPARVTAAERKVKRAFHLTLWLGLAVFGSLAAFSWPLLHAWLGHNLSSQLPGAFRMMLCATFASLLGVPAFYKLLGSGRVAHCFWASALQGVLNALILFLSFSVTHTVSITDTCWAVLVSMFASTIYLLWHGRSLSSLGSVPISSGVSTLNE